VVLERGPLSLVSTTEELLERKSSGFSPENRECGGRDPSRLLRGTLSAKVDTNYANSGHGVFLIITFVGLASPVSAVICFPNHHSPRLHLTYQA
jgi:hypothetical protein